MTVQHFFGDDDYVVPKGPVPTEAETTLAGMDCDHPKMDECHKGCGHWVCPDCGISFDDGAGG